MLRREFNAFYPVSGQCIEVIYSGTEIICCAVRIDQKEELDGFWEF